jgi:hypothetical protein
MTRALAESDFATKLLVQTNQHRRWMQSFGFRVSAETDDRAARQLHSAINHQPHQAEY